MANKLGFVELLKKMISCLFILSIIIFSFFLFCRRDILIYEDKYGYFGVLVLCFICNASIFAPAPSLVVAISASQTLNPVIVILISSIGTALGEMVGYIFGRMGYNLSAKGKSLTSWVINKGALAVFLFASLPLPLFDLVGIVAGYSRIKWYKFATACFLGKLIKFSVYVLFGVFLKNNFQNIITLV